MENPPHKGVSEVVNDLLQCGHGLLTVENFRPEPGDEPEQECFNAATAF